MLFCLIKWVVSGSDTDARMSNTKQILSETELIEYWENFTSLKNEDGGDISESYYERDPFFVPEDDFVDDMNLVESSGEPMETIEQEIHPTISSLTFVEGLFERIVRETNLFSVQKKPERPTVFTEIDIIQYIGIIKYMSLFIMPNTRSFWSNDLRFSNIADVMSVNKFGNIRQYIHFNNNQTFIPRDHPGHDRLHKIRPLVDNLNKKCSSIALKQHLNIDEQMCSTIARHYMKQYMPMKPHKWGFKFFVLAGVSGFAYKFEICQEKFDNLKNDERNLGVTSNIVLRLARIILRMKNYRLYHDNYYTALPLMVYLAKQGIFSLSTIRRNRLPNCQLLTELLLKKASRSISHEYVATVDGVDISSLIWKDNKYVTFISSFAGKNPVSKVRRFDHNEKKNIDVDCPYIITEYNRHIGRVDLLDSLMGIIPQ
ncbi:hypothetical protein NQ314_016193 [Rhamnusium bicolor]|uniref:PiggyBac transposable element-derived protein domain-containing protein n=1 Tax=Rhamnusium bicolor TaxID=1586634 RepID=A0AAV8WWU2_9CUCU|nr:hypothetical protein NQ314_016193 [Rhamnusium bicolor]